MATVFKIELDLVNNDKKTQFINVYHVLIEGKIIVTKIKYTYDKKTGVIIRKEYADNENRLHRDANSYDGEGPAVINYKNGNVISESWYSKGMLHRDDGLPAFTRYSDDGKTTIMELWYMNSTQYRNDDLPNVVGYYEATGKVSYVSWRVEGYLHRDPAKGPAHILYDEDGSIKETKYYKNGIKIVTPGIDELKRLIPLLNNEEIAAVTNMIKLIKK